VGILAITCFYALKKDLSSTNKSSITSNSISDPALPNFTYSQVNLVADITGFGAAMIDPNLVNSWGMASPPNGPIWISDNGAGVSTLYNRTTGATLRPPVTIPAAITGQSGAPTGIIFNSTADFGGNKFIFAGEDGIIAAWNGGNAAVKVADRSQFNAVYKGMTMANDGTGNFLYVTNFKGGKIDVFDKNFNYVTTKPFIDPTIPAGFAPFNIQLIGQFLYVTYAKQKGPDNKNDLAAPNNGYVDIFTPMGIFKKRFASQGELDSPWGIATAPAGFAAALPTILIGNFGNGHINVFDSAGDFLGLLKSNGQLVVIDGLWALDFLNGNIPNTGSPSDWLYFTSGPDGESHGLFGYLQKQ
jgi:uncharacterized protein (TIGR03118 family)